MNKTSRPAVRWARVTERSMRRGHGVEFHHETLQRDTVVAFIEGYRWRDVLGEEVTVQILGRAPTESGVDSAAWKRVVQEVKKSALRFLEMRRPGCLPVANEGRISNVWVWYNA